MENSQKLTKEQKEAIGLLSIGTFLEYFDVMLYVHMAILLNDLFFPKTDAFSASLVSAFAFCSTYIFRPVGALFFGWIGDTVGRKSTVILTTMMMACSCAVMSVLPTYAQVGITATIIVTICRMVQGMSSMGELVGAQLYLSEMLSKSKNQCSLVSIASNFSAVGGMAALGVAAICTHEFFKDTLAWRAAFGIGAVVALIGTIARTALRESSEFVDARKRVTDTFEKTGLDTSSLEKNLIWNEKINKKSALYYFFIECAYPVWFYLVYMHSSQILKTKFGLSSELIIRHNFYVSFVAMIGFFTIGYLARIVHPFKLLKFKLIFSCISVYVFINMDTLISSPSHMMIFQIVAIVLQISNFPAIPLFLKRFPVLKRFRSSAMLYALSRSFMYLITSFGIVFLTKKFGNFGLGFILIPVLTCYAIALNHFENMEATDSNYQKKIF